MSTSKYLQELIPETWFLRQQGQLKIGDRRQVDQLRDEIEQLEQQIENTEHNPSTAGNQELVFEEEAQQVLTYQYTRSTSYLTDCFKTRTSAVKSAYNSKHSCTT